ncbi:MsnO8 family LLM class oxidoreductase [Kitasatospora sp. NPDC036755]|uniref:MsnO8 family LLM class oxidoreductase n=1 Tax=Kitasatospora sp. NPDC036755 TaxID=3154600 RepID=UPI0033D9EEB7
MKISVLDLCPVFEHQGPAAALRGSIELARKAEEFGAARYLVAEHHANPASAATAPEVLISAIANETSTLRVGAGGIMLPNHAPFRVAESFRALARLHGPRIELGVVRALAGRPALGLALRGTTPSAEPERFRRQIAELVGHLDDMSAAEAPIPVRVLGSSPPVAQLAAELGLPYGFAGHLSLRGARQAADTYRRHYRPSPGHPEPDLLLSLGVYLSDDPGRAAALARVPATALLHARQGRPSPLPTVPQAAETQPTGPEQELLRRRLTDWLVGDRQTAVARLCDLATELAATEICAVTSIADPDERTHSYRLLAAAARSVQTPGAVPQGPEPTR